MLVTTSQSNSVRPPLTREVADSIRDALPPEHQGIRPEEIEPAAEAARIVLAARLSAHAEALARVCVKHGHTHDKKPCKRCAQRIKHTRDAAAIVAPDQPE